jgi:hypothetical protein
LDVEDALALEPEPVSEVPLHKAEPTEREDPGVGPTSGLLGATPGVSPDVEG